MTPEQLLDLKMNEPLSPVARFRQVFPDSPKTYTYAAIKAGGAWYVTGRDGSIGRPWADLIDLLCRDNATIDQAQTATTLEDIL